MWQLFIFMELELFFYYFYDNQVTGSESCKIKIGVAGPIFARKNIKGYMVQLYIYYTIWEQKIVVVLHIYGALAISLLFCDHQDTESE